LEDIWKDHTKKKTKMNFVIPQLPVLKHHRPPLKRKRESSLSAAYARWHRGGREENNIAMFNDLMRRYKLEQYFPRFTRDGEYEDRKFWQFGEDDLGYDAFMAQSDETLDAFLERVGADSDWKDRLTLTKIYDDGNRENMDDDNAAVQKMDEN
jgi:hypothetical protein